MPNKIKRVLDEVPERFDLHKKFEVDANYLSVYVDLFDRDTGKAYMIERPIRASEQRISAFLANTAKIVPQN